MAKVNDDEMRTERTRRAHRGATAYAVWLALNDEDGEGEAPD